MTDTPEGTGTEPLSISDAAKAYAEASEPVENPETDTQDEPEQITTAKETDGEQSEDALSEEDELAEYADDEGQAEEEQEDGSQETEQGRFVADDAKVRLADGTVATVGELRRGSLMQADYTRKSMELAEERKAFDADRTKSTEEIQRVKSLDAELQQQREVIAAFADVLLPKEPDMAMLDPASDKYDPVAYQLQAATAQRQRDQFAKVQQQIQGHRVRQQKENEDAFQKHVAEQKAELHKKAPELADPANFQDFWNQVVEAGKDYGFSEADWSQITNHSSYLVMRDALAYRRIKAKRAAAKAKGEGKPPVMEGGRRRNAAQQQQRTANDAMERLNKSGSLRDGVAALIALEKG